jgi:hypothetical protein
LLVEKPIMKHWHVTWSNMAWKLPR